MEVELHHCLKTLWFRSSDRASGSGGLPSKRQLQLSLGLSIQRASGRPESKDSKLTAKLTSFKAVSGREGEYIAYYTSKFFEATFSVYFKDNIMGAIALQNFSEMIKLKYEKEKVDFNVSGEDMRFKSRNLLEVMSWSSLRE